MVSYWAKLVLAEDVATADAVRGQDMVAGCGPVMADIHEVAAIIAVFITAFHRGIDAPETPADLGQHTLGRKDGIELADTFDVTVIEQPNGVGAVTVVEVERLVNPRFVMQSTGIRRWVTDRWADDLKERVRLVSVRAGACGVHVDAEGDLSYQRFLSTIRGKV